MATRFGKYEVVEELASGGFGKVYRGYDPMIKRSVAIKTCSAQDEVTRSRFALEAEIAGNLHHRNITTVHDYGLEGETPYLVQELLNGEDLDRKIAQREEISYADKVRYLLQIASGLEHSHQQGVVHRDLKPANIHILPDGTAKIMDFGVARFLHQTTGLTTAGQTVGTTAYLAPEQIRGETLDQRVDIFAFGALAYELVTYNRAFRGETISSTMFQIVNEVPAPIRSYWPDCPVELVRLIELCLEKEPGDRPQEFREIVAELERIRSTTAVQDLPGPALESDSPQAPPPAGPPEATTAPPKELPPSQAVARGRWRVIPIAAGALILLGIGAAAWFGLRGKEPTAGTVAGVEATPSATTGNSDAPAAPAAELPEPAPEKSPPAPPQTPVPATAVPDTRAPAARRAPAIERFRLTSSPPGARIWLDGRRLGEPATVELLPGASYRLRLELDGHQSVERDLSLESLSADERARQTVTVALSPRTAAPFEPPVAAAGADASSLEAPGSEAPRTVEPGPEPANRPSPAPVAVPEPAPAAVPPMPTGQDPNDAIVEIRRTLEAYEQAYRSLDVAAVQRAWPSIDAAQLEDSFSSLEAAGMRQEVDLDCSVPSVDGDRASVTCEQRVIVRSTSRQVKATETEVAIELEKTKGSWVIRSLRPR